MGACPAPLIPICSPALPTPQVYSSMVLFYMLCAISELTTPFLNLR